MKEHVEFYQKQAKQRQSCQPWLAQLQKNALTQLGKQGFPTRHDEEWKYTLVDELLNQSFITEQSTPEDIKILETPFTQSLTIKNGDIFGLDQLALPKGVLILPLDIAIKEQADLLKPYLGSILHSEHGFHALNTAMIQTGLFIYIPEGVIVEEPIVLSHIQAKDKALYLRHVIVAQAHSQVSLVETYQGEKDCSYLTNTITEISLATGAKVTHYKLQQESIKSYHLGHVAVKQADKSYFESHSFSFGAKLARSDLTINLEKEKAHCLMNGVYMTGPGQHVDHHTTVNHIVPNCDSEQNYKGILSGRSRGVFNGKVRVYKEAQHTSAKQQNKNLLLSNQAEIDTKPQLEIFANDVVCSHGATVGQLEEEALFYLATRGIDRQLASYYLIQAFAIENIRLISQSKLAKWIEELLMKQVEALL